MRYKIASLAAAAIAFGGVQVASAADMAVKARPMVAPVATYTWTGCYIGVHLGGVWTRADVTDTVPYAAASVPGAVTSVNGAGVIGGGQVGCDYQFNSIVVGVEIDGGYMGAAHTDLLTGTASGTRVGTRDGAFMDFTARVGVAVWNQTLLYVKGGAAYRNRLLTSAPSPVHSQVFRSRGTVGAGSSAAASNTCSLLIGACGANISTGTLEMPTSLYSTPGVPPSRSSKKLPRIP